MANLNNIKICGDILATWIFEKHWHFAALGNLKFIDRASDCFTYRRGCSDELSNWGHLCGICRPPCVLLLGCCRRFYCYASPNHCLFYIEDKEDLATIQEPSDGALSKREHEIGDRKMKRFGVWLLYVETICIADRSNLRPSGSRGAIYSGMGCFVNSAPSCLNSKKGVWKC